MSPADRFEAAVAPLRADPAVTPCRMFGADGLKAGGKVFAMLVRGELVVKLPRARVDALVAAGDGRPFDPGHGRPMKEWLSVPATASIPWETLVNEARHTVAGTLP